MDLKKKKIAPEKTNNNYNSNSSIEQKNFLEKRNKSFNCFKAELEPIFDSISDFLLVLDFQGNILMVNNVVLSHLGYKKEELLDMNLLNLHPSEKREEVLAVLKDILENKTDLCNIPLITKEKKLIPVETKVTKGTWNNKQVIFGISRDITERKKMEERLKESEEQYRITINSLADPLHVVDKNLKIILANPAFKHWLNLLGIKSEIVGKTVFEMFPFLPNKVREEYEYVFNSGKSIHTEESTYLNNEEIITETRKVPILKEGKVDQIITIVRDITQRKKFEKALKEAYNRVNLYKDIFMHDMNNILQNLASSLELSSPYLNNPEKLEKIKYFYDIMNEQVYRAVKLVSNVRKLSQIEDSQVVLKVINLNEILDESINFLKQSLQNKKFSIEINSFSKIIYVKANALLPDVFENILFNAVRHNQNLDITIDIKISQEQMINKKYVKIEFLDNGIGIEDARKKTIFNRGTLSENANKGMGLGLSLVKTIIDSYKGKIWVEDKIKGDYAKGSNFIILIPKA